MGNREFQAQRKGAVSKFLRFLFKVLYPKCMKQLSVYFIGLFLFIGCVTQTENTESMRRDVELKNCSIIDTDFSLDDLRAMTLIFPKFDYNLIVATEGMARIPYGAKVGEIILQEEINRFYGDIFEGKHLEKIKVTPIEGRELAETLFGYLPAPLTATGVKSIQDEEFLSKVKECQSVTVFLLGPLTSFHSYKKILNKNSTSVLIAGAVPNIKNKNISINCNYDRNSCFSIARDIQDFRLNFIRVVKNVNYSFLPQDAMLFEDTGFQRILKSIYSNGQAPQEDSLESDVVAFYLYSPKLFTKKRHQTILKLKPEAFRVEINKLRKK